MHPDALADNLRSVRKAHGYTQADMSKLLNVERQTYCNYEAGRRIPNVEALAAIADILGVTVDFLIKGNAGAEESLPLMELISGFLTLSEHDQKEVLNFISFRKSL